MGILEEFGHKKTIKVAIEIDKELHYPFWREDKRCYESTWSDYLSVLEVTENIYVKRKLFSVSLHLLSR